MICVLTIFAANPRRQEAHAMIDLDVVGRVRQSAETRRGAK
jgi:hypothetical protein